MLLAAGYGTRLRPLTDRLPKPLVPIGDRPAFAHLIDNLHRQLGACEVVVNTHHRAQQVKEFVEEHAPNSQVVLEPRILGTAGGVRSAWSHFRSLPVMVANADIMACPDYGRLLAAAGECTCCLCISPRERGQGSVGVDKAGRVVRLRGEVFGVEASGGDYMGIAVLGPGAIETLPSSGCLVGDWLLPRLRRGGEVMTHQDVAAWSDFGDLQSYMRANWAWLGLRGLKSWVAPDAYVVPGARLTNVVVGAGARVNAPGAYENAVVWPGATVDRVVGDGVVMDNGELVQGPGSQ